MRHLNWIVVFPFILIAISFAGTNRYFIELGFWPLPFLLEMPIALYSFIIFLLGIVVGGYASWNAGRPVRQQARNYDKELKKLHLELDRLKSENNISAFHPKDLGEIDEVDQIKTIEQK